MIPISGLFTALTTAINLARGGAAAAKDITDVGGALTKTISLADIGKYTRVEPLTIISRDCVNLALMPDLSNVLVNLFSAYYLQGINFLTKVNRAEVRSVLAAVNPNRNLGSEAFDQQSDFVPGFGFIGKEDVDPAYQQLNYQENYTYGLPSVFAGPRLGRTARFVGQEDDKTHAMMTDTIKQVNEGSSLAVGKLLSVEIGYDTMGSIREKDASGNMVDVPRMVSKSETIPVTVRLAPMIAPSETVQYLLTIKGQDSSFGERVWLWRAGQISLIKDLILCSDQIDAHKRAMVVDDTGAYKEIVRRVNNSRLMTMHTGTPSLAAASSIVVISEEDARKVEAKLMGKLSNPAVRRILFENVYAMFVCVVDRDRERVKIYTRNIAASVDVSAKELKSAAKDKSPDLTDMLKAMTMGMPPAF